MADFIWDILDMLTDPILEALFRFFRRGGPAKIQEDPGPPDEEERLRDKLEDRTRCLNRRM